MPSFSQFLKGISSDSNFESQIDSLSFENKNSKRFIILFTDIEECLEILWNFGDEIDHEFEGDWIYDETRYRRVLGKYLDRHAKSNSVATNLGSQTPNTVRALELYAAYLLGKTPPPILSDPTFLRRESLDAIFSRKGRFRKWLETNTELREKSIKEYTTSVGGILSKIAGENLYNIPANRLEQILSFVRDAPLFKDRNENGNGMYEAALKKYETFMSDSPIKETEPTTFILKTPFTNALLAKPFLILTGPSGTGKTRSAYREAKRTGGTEQCCLVAVGADWTDNRHILGFLNPLETVADPDDDDQQVPVYETTPIVDLILAAIAKLEAPHFLILDEMNLSHVERYFADFLSAMELEEKTGALKLHSAGAAATRSGIPIPRHLDFPENLFVIGTVNVDETTYMFSPKVLDRANVIEIRADNSELESFLKGDAEHRGEPEAVDYGVSFLDAAMELREGRSPGGYPSLPDPIRQEAADKLMQLFRILKKGRFEFGFRTGNEVLNFLRAGWFLAGPEENARNEWADEGWKSTFGEQVLQKLLPKLHGSKSRLSPLLGALGTWCATGNETLAMKHFPDDGNIPERSLKDALDEEGREFKAAYEKIVEMIHVLNSDQFVSFIC